MNNKITLFLILCLTLQFTQAQSLKEKLKASKEAILGTGNSGNGNSERTLNGYVSMDSVASYWKDGSYLEREESGGMWSLDDKLEVKMVRDDNNKIIAIDISGSEYKARHFDDSDFIGLFSYKGRNLYLTETSIIMYQYYTEAGDFHLKKCIGKKMSMSQAKKEIKEYRDHYLNSTEVDQKVASEERAKIAAEKAAIAKAHKEKWSVRGKEVASIMISNNRGVQPSLWLNEGYTKLGIVATLKDGSKIATERAGGEGYDSDYTIEKITKIKGRDAVTIKAYCNYSPSIKTSIILNISYQNHLTIKDNGYNGKTGAPSRDGARGGDAPEMIVYMKQIIHTETGEKLNRLKIVSNGNATYQTISSGASIDIILIGGNGGKGGAGRSVGKDEGQAPGDGGSGGRGGNGGVLTVIVDPGVSDKGTIQKNVSGGYGGASSSGGSCWSCSYGSSGANGSPGKGGSNGSYEFKNEKVNF